MNARKTIIISLLLLLSISTVSANIDSLNRLLRVAPYKASIYNELATAIRDSSRTESIRYSRLALEHAAIERNRDAEALAYAVIGQNFLAQSVLDSALVNLYKSLKICKEIERHEYTAEMLNSIGVVYYRKGEIDKVIEYWEESASYIEKSGNIRDNATLYNNLGLLQHHLGNYVESLYYNEKSIEIKKEFNDIKGIAYSYNNIGSIYDVLGDYSRAVENYHLSLSYSEQIDDDYMISVAYNNIATVLRAYGQTDNALEYFEKSLSFKQKINDQTGMANIYTNIGMLYQGANNDVEALRHLYKAKYIYEEIGHLAGLAIVHGNIGNLYFLQGDKKKALEYQNKALEISMQARSQISIIRSYLNLGKIYSELMQYGLSEEYFLRSLNTQGGTNTTRIDAMREIANLYNTTGRFEDAVKYLFDYIELKDSVFNETKHKQITQMQTIYETEKKKQQIETQELVIEAQMLENRRQIVVRNFLITGSLLFVIIAVIAIIAYRHKKKSSRLINEKNVLLEQVNEEVRAQNEEIESQNKTVTTQKNLLEAQQKKINDSITYAKHIQSALMLSETYAQQLLGERYYVIFKPKEIVSGDFYWASKVKDDLVIVVADCTGHGVSGAFMSLLMISFLNEIVRKKEITNPAAILTELRNSVVESFVFNADSDMKREGMTASVTVINEKSKSCNWAGARNPTWVMRKHYAGKQSIIIERLKSDATSVALHNKMKDYNSRELNLNPGDRLYMFTDGIIDQFGGKDGTKFSSDRLEKILLKTADSSLNTQGKTLETEINKWLETGNNITHDQIDDITFLAIEIN